MRPLAGLLVLLVLGGCGSSPPTQFYTLDPVLPAQKPVLDAGTTVAVAAVHIPSVLDRREMVRESGSNTLAISDRDRWAAPLDEMIRRVLVQDLMDRLGTGAVLAPGEPGEGKADRIVLDILRFDKGAGGDVVFAGTWSLVAPGAPQPRLNQPLDLEVPAEGKGFAGQAKAMSQALGEIADTLATVIAPPAEPLRSAATP